MEGDKFCTACGAMLPDGATFCPQCGRSLDGSAPTGGYGYDPWSRDPRAAQAKTGPSFAILILIYGLFAIFGGVFSGITLGTLDQASFDATVEMLEEYGLDMSGWTLSMVHEWAIGMYILAVSGVAAVISYYYCRKAENWKYAVAFCGIASVLTLGMAVAGFSDGLILCPIGLIITYLVYARRDTFKSRPLNGGVGTSASPPSPPRT